MNHHITPQERANWNQVFGDNFEFRQDWFSYAKLGEWSRICHITGMGAYEGDPIRVTMRSHRGGLTGAITFIISRAHTNHVEITKLVSHPFSAPIKLKIRAVVMQPEILIEILDQAFDNEGLCCWSGIQPLPPAGQVPWLVTAEVWGGRHPRNNIPNRSHIHPIETFQSGAIIPAGWNASNPEFEHDNINSIGTNWLTYFHTQNTTFAQSANGRLRLPNGFTLQWGRAAVSPTGIRVVFPASFTATYQVVCQTIDFETTPTTQPCAGVPDTTGVNLYMGGGATRNVSWLATGFTV